MYPSTPQEAKEIGFKHYFTKKPCIRGHIDLKYVSSKECVSCRRIKNNSPELKAKQKQWSINNKDYKKESSRKRYQDNIEKERERSRRKWFLNPEKVKETNKKWLSKHKNYFTFAAAKRRAKLRKRTPIWSNVEAIKLIYKNCPKGFHVDHIIPLQGKKVSGLHVEYNLQYLTSTENQKKYNKFEEI